MKHVHLILLLLCFVTLLAVPTEAAQHINWKIFETEHFKIIFHEEVFDQAKAVATIAEDVFNSQARFTGFQSYRKIAIIVSGLDDFSNGFAIPRDVMKVWVNTLHVSTRTDLESLKNLVTHELTHILQMEATFGATYWLQKMTGASTILALPPNAFHPTWFIEGAAQYGSARQGYDSLDRKREMIMEQKIQNQWYTDAEILWFRSDIGGEIAYNYGFGFFSYLMDTYGEKKFLELQKAHNNFYLLGLENTARMIYGKPFKDLVAEWKEALEANFPPRTDREIAKPITRKPELTEWKEPITAKNGDIIFAEIAVNRPSVKIRHFSPKTGLTTLVDNPALAFTRLALAGDGQRLLYTAYHIKAGLVQYDLYELNLATKKTTRLTNDGRILQGVHFKDGYLVVKNDWGHTQLYYLAKGEMTKLTDYDFNFSITDLAVSPDQSRVAVNFNYNGKRGIGVLDATSWTYEKVYYPNAGLDWLLGEFVDNTSLTLSWDRANHYDLYSLNLLTGECTLLTNTREDILDGRLIQQNGELTWAGQIYGPTGFTIASGPARASEVINLLSFTPDFLPAKETELTDLQIKDYNNFAQLRSDVFLPYFTSGENGLVTGVTQLWMDPLMELQVLYDLHWNFDLKTPVIDLQAVWVGANPSLSLAVKGDRSAVSVELAESYDAHPFYLGSSVNLSYQDSFAFDSVNLQLARVWETANPGTTSLTTTFYPPADNKGSGLAAILQHGQNFSLGYHGDTLTSETYLGYAGGEAVIPWGQEGFMWVYPNKSYANMMALQRLKLQHNLLDISANLMGMLQTGRVYLNIFGETGLFLENTSDVVQTANMIGAGLELESTLFHLLPMSPQVNAAINTSGDYSITASLNAPF